MNHTFLYFQANFKYRALLRFFRINDPYRLLGLLVLTLVLWLPYLLDAPATTVPELESIVIGEKAAEGYVPYAEIIDNTGPLAMWYYGLCDMIFGRSYSARHIVAILILFLQSAYWGILLINKKAFTENTFIPSFLFSVLALLSFDFFTLHADVAAFGFSLLMLNNLYKEIEFGGQRDETIFNLGIYIGIASLLNYSFVIFVPGSILILLLYTTNRLRSYLLLIFGAAFPHILLFLYYYWNNEVTWLWSGWYAQWFVNSRVGWLSFTGLLALGAIPIFYMIISFFILNREARFTKYQSQILQATNLWMLICICQIWITPDRRPQSLIVLIPSASFMMSHFLLTIRRTRFASMNTWILLLGTVSAGLLTRYQWLPTVDFSRFYVSSTSLELQGNRILDLDGDLSSYQHNLIAPPFINKELSAEILKQPEFYENVLLVDKLFEADPPSVIYDRTHILQPYFDRIPYLGARYSRTESGYRLKKPSN